MTALSESQLAERAGVTGEYVGKLVDLGIIHPLEDGSGFAHHDVDRVRLAEALEGEGVSLQHIGQAVEAGAITFDWVLSDSGSGLTPTSYQEAAAAVGLPVALVDRLYTLWGMATHEPGDRATDEDVQILATVASMYRTLDEDGEALVAGVRYFGENLRRIAESAVRFVRSGVAEPLLASGMAPLQALTATAERRVQLTPDSEQLLGLLYRRMIYGYLMQERIQLMEELLQAAGVARPRPAHPPAIAFFDVSGYTRLTEEAGDEAAAQLSAALGELVGQAARRYGGRAVKLLGDGVMFHFPDPRRAVTCALAMVRRAAERELPPARVGVHAGPLVFRDGDYFGRTVNIAARITDYARPGEVLVSEDVTQAEPDLRRYRLIGPIALKGLSGPITLYVADSTAGDHP